VDAQKADDLMLLRRDSLKKSQSGHDGDEKASGDNTTSNPS
jgi:hypothetical protein